MFTAILVVLGSLVLATGTAEATLILTPVNAGNQLASRLIGANSGVQLEGNATYTAASAASALFSGGLSAAVPFDSGILMTTGLAVDAVGPNQRDDTGTNHGRQGDAQLESQLPAGSETFDAAVLEFDFTAPDLQGQLGQLNLTYIFASEEYPEGIGAGFGDAMAVFLDGNNIALHPDRIQPIWTDSIFNVNFPFLFFDNARSSIGTAPFDIEYDALTVLLLATAPIQGAGVHHLKIVIADVGDGGFDGAVFIESLTVTPQGPIPEPPTLGLLGVGAIILGRRRRARG